ncbi:MAG: hypothetical protein EA393_09515 [Bacteroidetes bacterium]|nr:MAG: hypothetical protein EA393_09515 [Bacteroidota bacterium]
MLKLFYPILLNPVRSKLYSIFVFFTATIILLISPTGNAQFKTDPDNFNIQDYGPFEEMKDFFSHQKNYVPGQPLNEVVKTIYVAFNIWQYDDGSGSFQETDEVLEQISQIIKWMNYRFRNNPAPSHPVEGVDYLTDSHIQFEIKDISFYRNSEMMDIGCFHGRQLNEAVFNKHPHKRRYLNIHLTQGDCRGGSGYANYPSSGNLETDSYNVGFVIEIRENLEDFHFWALMIHVSHEMGHNLDLRHPYDSEFCNFSHPDFLFDLFGFEKQDWCENPRPGCDICFHQGGWSCDRNDPETTCTNNMMGGNRGAVNITPLQMGRMNRALALKSARKYTWAYSDNPFTVNSNQKWTDNIKFYQDILIKEGNSLHLTGTLEMVPEASIILEPGARLIVDGGLITNALYSDFFWQGVYVKPPEKRGFLFWRKKTPGAEVILVNKGAIENYLK